MTAKTSAGSRGTRPRTTKASDGRRDEQRARRRRPDRPAGRRRRSPGRCRRGSPARRGRSGSPAGRGRRASVAAAPRAECTAAAPRRSSVRGRAGCLRPQVETTSNPRPRATPIWAGSNVTKRTGAGIRSAAARWIALVEPDGLLAGEAGGAVEAALVDGDDVEVVPRQAHGVLEVEAQHGLVGQPVDRRQRLGERQRRGAPHRVAVERGEHDRPLGAVDGEGEQRAGVEGDGHRTSARARSMRTPDHTVHRRRRAPGRRPAGRDHGAAGSGRRAGRAGRRAGH